MRAADTLWWPIARAALRHGAGAAPERVPSVRQSVPRPHPTKPDQTLPSQTPKPRLPKTPNPNPVQKRDARTPFKWRLLEKIWSTITTRFWAAPMSIRRATDRDTSADARDDAAGPDALACADTSGRAEAGQRSAESSHPG